MRASLLVVCAFLLVGCGSQLSIEQRQAKNENSIKSLLSGAKDIRADLLKSKEECEEMILRSQEKIGKADEMLAKIDQLLGGGKPQPIVPTPNPSPSPNPQPVPSPVNPTPAPIPSPTPAVPVDGRFGVAVAVWKIAQTVDSPERQSEADALSLVFSGIAADLKALVELEKKDKKDLSSAEKDRLKELQNKVGPGIVPPQWHKISSALTAGNKPVIARHPDAWEGPATQLGKKIAQFYKEGKLNSNEDWADLLEEIALGLRFRSK